VLVDNGLDEKIVESLMAASISTVETLGVDDAEELEQFPVFRRKR